MAEWVKKLKKEWEADFEKNNPRQAALQKWLNSERAQAGVLGFFLQPLMTVLSWVLLVGGLWLIVILVRGLASSEMSFLEAYIFTELFISSMVIAVFVGVFHGLVRWVKATRRKVVRENEEIRRAVREQKTDD